MRMLMPGFADSAQPTRLLCLLGGESPHLAAFEDVGWAEPSKPSLLVSLRSPNVGTGATALPAPR
jgi:hypothetical protein